ncbi:MAG: hypothetical protein QNJ72_35915 [Pleurocapsa sp. MO_226.B13]|nr:hypothetical protein [Pleurocapsa sp. MO_226.B13]
MFYLWQPTDTMAIAQLEHFAQGTTDGRELERFELLSQGISPERIDQLIPNRPEDETTSLIFATQQIKLDVLLRSLLLMHENWYYFSIAG